MMPMMDVDGRTPAISLACSFLSLAASRKTTPADIHCLGHSSLSCCALFPFHLPFLLGPTVRHLTRCSYAFTTSPKTCWTLHEITAECPLHPSKCTLPVSLLVEAAAPLSLCRPHSRVLCVCVCVAALSLAEEGEERKKQESVVAVETNELVATARRRWCTYPRHGDACVCVCLSLCFSSRYMGCCSPDASPLPRSPSPFAPASKSLHPL